MMGWPMQNFMGDGPLVPCDCKCFLFISFCCCSFHFSNCHVVFAQEFNRILNAGDPNASKKLVRFHFKEGAYREELSSDQTATHLQVDGCVQESVFNRVCSS